MHRRESGNIWGLKEALMEELGYLNRRAIISAVTTIYSAQKYIIAEEWIRV